MMILMRRTRIHHKIGRTHEEHASFKGPRAFEVAVFVQPADETGSWRTNGLASAVARSIGTGTGIHESVIVGKEVAT